MKPSFNRQYCVPNTIILIFQLLGVYIAIMAFNKLTKSKLFLEDLVMNWQSKPFQSINIFDDSCPVDLNYDYFKLNRYYLKCVNKDEFGSLHKELYDYNFILDKSNSTICGRKMQFNYLDYLNNTYTTNENRICEKTCGYLDTINNTLCIGANQTCPINRIEFTSKNLTTHENLIDVSEDFYLKLENKPINDSKVILGLDLIDGNIFKFLYRKTSLILKEHVG